jgi:DNA-binding MarR family transcriptional regulator
MSAPDHVDDLAAAFAQRLSALQRELVHQIEGPSRSQHATLARLDHQGPQRITALAAAERIAQPSMTALVSRLEKAGWVVRSPDAGDRRAVVVSLTETGRAELERLRDARTRVLADRLGKLTSAERRTLAAALPVFDEIVARAATGTVGT